MYFTGIIIAICTFLTIGIWHPIVIKTEYYWGTRPWIIYLLIGLASLVAALFIENTIISAVVGVFGSGDTEVEINISASDFANIDKFTSFGCRFDVTGNETFPLTIGRVSQEANTSQLYTVRLKFTGAIDHKKITPGMTTMVYAEVSGNDASGIVSVPASAVLNEEGKTLVYIYDEKSGVVKSRAVTVTSIQRDGTMQVENGLKSGETIVVSGVHHVKDGQKVKILEKPSASNVGGLL